MDQELTFSEILTDPLIRVMLKADGISLGDFADIVHQAAERLNPGLAYACHKGSTSTTSPASTFAWWPASMISTVACESV
ncbi:hypothetical protein FHW37_101654 [Neorhizobium alkalisoli]|uniref:Uncharacterized protein n=1 Tax=Neorhizobium alkalisoli TaxID=528178 RepID=A0A561R8B3_9HYPH|nr:hypothetical protein FHW37_101654 [Neorhizobium alkalisoli]